MVITQTDVVRASREEDVYHRYYQQEKQLFQRIGRYRRRRMLRRIIAALLVGMASAMASLMLYASAW